MGLLAWLLGCDLEDAHNPPVNKLHSRVLASLICATVAFLVAKVAKPRGSFGGLVSTNSMGLVNGGVASPFDR